MSWNYRIVHLDLASPNETWMEIREVYYDEAGRVIGWTEKAAGVCGNNAAELGRVLDTLRDALGKPTLQERELP